MGVRLGMPIAQAVDITSTLADQHNSSRNVANQNVSSIPAAIIDEHDRVADRRALHSLATELQSHLCPQIALETLDRFKWAGRFRHDPEAL
ncbi:MAG: DNA polymerase Y family protein, partial [Rhodopirellula bahusiensis]